MRAVILLIAALGVLLAGCQKTPEVTGEAPKPAKPAPGAAAGTASNEGGPKASSAGDVLSVNPNFNGKGAEPGSALKDGKK